MKMQSGPEKGLLDEWSSWLKKIIDADPRMEINYLEKERWLKKITDVCPRMVMKSLNFSYFL